MRILAFIICLIASALIVFNFTKVNFEAPLTGESTIALITILASLCAMLLMFILIVSKRIEQRLKERQ